MSPNSPSPELERMLSAVRRRLAWAAFGRALLWSAAAGCAAAACLAPLAWWRPDWLPTLITAAVPAAALLTLGLAATFCERPTREDAASRADRHAGSKDLFLTAAELGGAAGAAAFAPLVHANAAARVSAVDPAAAVPFGLPGRRLLPAGVALAVLIGSLFLVPRVDPFGAVAAAAEAEDAAKQSARTSAEAKRRTEELQRTQPEKALSPKVSAAVQKLADELKRAKRQEVKPNRKKLADRQQELGRLWQDVSAEMARGLLGEENDRRSLGLNPDAAERKQWRRELKAGNADGVREALNQMAAEAAEAAAEMDPAARAEQLAALREQARKLENFARNDVGDDRLADAMRQAGEQLRQAAEQAKAEANGEGSPQATRQAMQEAAEAAKAVLEQAGLEAEQLAQTARDMAELEQAMETARQAGRLNERGELDGQEATDAASMAEFLEVYEEMLAESDQAPAEVRDGAVRGSGEGEEGEGPGGEGEGGQGEGGEGGDGEGGEGDGDGGDGDGEGEGDGGGGRGERDEVDGRAMGETPDAETGFRTEVSRSHLVAGKMLWDEKSKGDSERGERTTEYRDNIARVQEGVDEAIFAEDVPPGYRDGIKQYFDSLTPPAGDE